MKMSSSPKAELSAVSVLCWVWVLNHSNHRINAQALQISRSRTMEQPPQCPGLGFSPAETNIFLPLS